MLGEALSAVREAIRESEAGSAQPASSRRFCTPTGNAGIHEISSSPQTCPFPATYFLDVPADQSRDVLTIASGVGPDLALLEHGPCLVGITVTLDDVSSTTNSAIHSGGDTIAPYRYAALLDTVFPQTFIRRDVFDGTLLLGASAACERPAALVPGVALANLSLCKPRPKSA